MSSPVASADQVGSSPTARTRSRAPGQLRSLVRACHLPHAVAVAVVIGALVALMGRPAREILVSAAAVLAAQLLLGLLNDVCDVEEDQATQAPGKPIAAGYLPRGNATYAATVLLLITVPLALQNGIVAGVLLLGALAIGAAHNRWLHRGAFSWVAWAAGFALLVGFVSYGGWGTEADGSAPVTSFVVLAALLGVLVHLATSLPDLVTDHRGSVRHLPLRIALRTGAPKFFYTTVVGLILVLAAMVDVALTTGIAV